MVHKDDVGNASHVDDENGKHHPPRPSKPQLELMLRHGYEGSCLVSQRKTHRATNSEPKLALYNKV